MSNHNRKLENYRAKKAAEARRARELADAKRAEAKMPPATATAPAELRADVPPKVSPYDRLLKKLDADRAARGGSA